MVNGMIIKIKTAVFFVIYYVLYDLFSLFFVIIHFVISLSGFIKNYVKFLKLISNSQLLNE